MAKKKGKVDIDFDNLLGTMDSMIETVNPNHYYDPEEARHEDCISCGSRLIDSIVGSFSNPGVLFTGRISEFIGMEGAGKTTLVIQAAAQAQKDGKNVVIFDTEKKMFSVEHMERLGIDFTAKGNAGGDDTSKGFVKIIKCSTLEDIDDHMMNWQSSGFAAYIDVVFIDSIATAKTRKQLELGISDSRQAAQHAFGVQKLFDKIRFLKDEFGWAVGTVNQLRRKPEMGGMFQAKAVSEKGLGQSNDTSWDKTGGRAYKHDLHQVIFLDTMKVEKNEAGEIIRQYIRVTTHKNMVGSTGRKVLVKLVQNKGFDDEETLIELLQDWGYIQHTSGGRYVVYDSTDEDAEPVITVKGADNILKEVKAKKGLLDKLYDLFFILADQYDESSEDEGDEEENEDEDEIEVD